MTSSDRRRILSIRSALLGGLWLCLLAAGPVFAAAGLEEDGPNSKVTDATDVPPRSGESASPSKKRALSLGFFLLGCLIVGGSLFLAIVVMWGNRTRRLARSPLPPVSNRDELWFLKPKKSPGNTDSEDEPKLDSGSNSGTITE